MQHWTIGKKIAAGFAVTVVLAIGITFIGAYSLRTAVSSKDDVIHGDAQGLIDAQRLLAAEAEEVAAVRGYILDSDEDHLDRAKSWRKEMADIGVALRKTLTSPEETRMLNEIDSLHSDYAAEVERIVEMKKGSRSTEDISAAFAGKLVDARQRLDGSIRALTEYALNARDEALKDSNEASSHAIILLIVISALLIALSIALATTLTRGLTRQVGSAVQQVQSSSAELQSAASQQATAATEQSTAMNEITTTISELLATSRQIAESAQRVSQIGEQTARSAGSGEITMERATQTFQSIQNQMEMIVGHMLDLGKKSRHIGAVLEIVAELAEQTNILAINATIEAAGAGDAGKRFAVVADEIRKLADRVTGSTKEIRGLIDDVRSAVNTTVMATETGSKAVDAGSKQFGDAAKSFKQIAGMVTTTTEASREIELSTKQQTTAVEQVNLAVKNVSQAARESESSSSQTQQTAMQLSTLSTALLRLVKSNL
jgi:methyl-accepting chemotaxis protein